MIKIKKATLAVVLLSIILLTGFTKSATLNAESKADFIAIKNVNVITMKSENVLINQTVLIQNGVIIKIGTTDSVKLTKDYTVIDARGKYLLPGIIDMHVHLMDKDHLKLFACNGVTTIRNMAEFPDAKQYPKSIQNKLNYSMAVSLKEAVKKGGFISPRIIQAGHILDGNPPYRDIYCTPLQEGDDIEKIIKAEKEKGYDYIKIYWNLSKQEFYAIIDAAQKYHIKVIGHVPNSITYEEAVKAGLYTIEHLTGLYDGQNTVPRIEELSKFTKEANCWLCPTLIELKDMLPPDNPGFKALLNQVEKKYIKKELRKFWDGDIQNWGSLTGYAGEAIDYFKFLVGEFHKQGVPIVAGTDCGAMPYVLPGYSIHEEMELLSQCGFSNYETLKSATIDAAKCLNMDSEIGSIAVGKKADLILVDNNPIQDIKNTKIIAGVMLNGKWISKIDIANILQSLPNED